MLTTFQKRTILFLFGCMGVRSVLAYAAKVGSDNLRILIAYFTITVAISLIYLFVSGKRKNGPEVFGEGIWWNNLRLVHASLYLLFAYLVYTGHQTSAWKVLALDVLVGLTGWMYHHFM